MEEPSGRPEEMGSHSSLGRRKFLVAAAVAGTAAWAVPTIITMEPAGAATLTSPPPVPPVEVLPETLVNPAVGPAAPAVQVEPEVEVRGALAMTGAEIGPLLGAGIAAIAGGAALHHWSADAARRQAEALDALRASEPPPPPPD
jgi:hypothetical protein